MALRFVQNEVEKMRRNTERTQSNAYTLYFYTFNKLNNFAIPQTTSQLQIFFCFSIPCDFDNVDTFLHQRPENKSLVEMCSQIFKQIQFPQGLRKLTICQGVFNGTAMRFLMQKILQLPSLASLHFKKVQFCLSAFHQFRIPKTVEFLQLQDIVHSTKDSVWFENFVQYSQLSSSRLDTLVIVGNFLDDVTMFDNPATAFPPTLTRLDLSHNSISDAGMANFQQYVHLRHICLDDNHLTTLPQFPHTLQTLSMKKNCFHQLCNNDLEHRTKPTPSSQQWRLPVHLLYLDLRYNNISWSFLTAVPLPPYLEELRVSQQCESSEQLANILTKMRLPPSLSPSKFAIQCAPLGTTFNATFMHRQWTPASYQPVHLLYSYKVLIEICRGVHSLPHSVNDAIFCFLQQNRGAKHIRQLILTFFNLFNSATATITS